MATQMTVWRPFADFGELRQRVDQMFREMGVAGEQSWTPSVDVLRRDGAVVLRADLPGIKPDEGKVTVEDGVLEVTIPLPEAEQRKPVKIETKSKAG
jgi:HSP20 family protein